MPNYFQQYCNGVKVKNISRYDFYTLLKSIEEGTEKPETGELYVKSSQEGLVYFSLGMARPKLIEKQELGGLNFEEKELPSLSDIKRHQGIILDILSKRGDIQDEGFTPATIDVTKTEWLFASDCLDETRMSKHYGAGKWILSYPRSQIDAAWNRILPAVQAGLIPSVEVSTVNPAPQYNGQHVLLAYADHYDKDIFGVIRVYDTLNALGLFRKNQNIKFKLNEQTRQGQDGKDAWYYQASDLPALHACAEQTPYFSDRFDARFAGKTTIIYRSLFAETKAILRGEKKLFANTRKWWNGGNTTLFKDTKDLFAGKRPVFANTRATFFKLEDRYAKSEESKIVSREAFERHVVAQMQRAQKSHTGIWLSMQLPVYVGHKNLVAVTCCDYITDVTDRFLDLYVPRDMAHIMEGLLKTHGVNPTLGVGDYCPKHCEPLTICGIENISTAIDVLSELDILEFKGDLKLEIMSNFSALRNRPLYTKEFQFVNTPLFSRNW